MTPHFLRKGGGILMFFFQINIFKFTIELRDTGAYGFALPESQIKAGFLQASKFSSLLNFCSEYDLK